MQQISEINRTYPHYPIIHGFDKHLTKPVGIADVEAALLPPGDN